MTAGEQRSSSLRSLMIRYFSFCLVQNLGLWAPVYVLFVMARGFSLTEVTVLSSIWWATAVIAEVPSGILADRWGRKKCLLLSSAVLIGAFASLYVADSFISIAAAYVLWAIAVSLSSGADSAFLYDALLGMGRGSEYRRLYGMAVSIGIVAAAAGALAGGFVGAVDLSFPIVISAALGGVQLFIAATFPESKVERRRVTPLLQLRTLKRTDLTSVLWGIIAVSAAVYVTVWIVDVFYQPYLREIGFDVASIGAFFFCFKLAGAAGSYACSRIEEKSTGAHMMFVLMVVLAASVIALSFAGLPWAIAFILVRFFCGGYLRPLINILINERISTEHRATVLSLNNFVGSLLLVPLQPLLGVFADGYGIQAGFAALGIFTVAGSVIAYRVSRSIMADR